MREMYLVLQAEAEAKATIMADLLREERGPERSFDQSHFNDFGKFNLESFRDTITLSEQYIFRTRYDWLETDRWYLRNGVSWLPPTVQIGKVRAFAVSIEQLLKEFNDVFLPD